MMLGYTRCSTAEQAAAGTTTMQEQSRIITAMAMVRGVGAYELQIYADPGVSGSIKLKYRPEGGKLFADAKRGDVVVAAKLDRIFRDSLDAQACYSDFKERGVDLILYDMGTESVIKDSMSHFFYTMLSAFATLERERIRERMLEGKKAKKAKGGHVGGEAKYGFKIVGQGREARLEIEPEEQKVVSLVNQLALSHDSKAIVKELEERQFKTRTGKRFACIQVERILQVVHAQGSH